MKEIQKKYKRTNKNTVFIGLILLAFFFLTAATLSWYGAINYDSATGVFSFKTTPQTPNTYVVDLNEVDMGAVGSGRSLRDILTTIGTSAKAKVIFERGSSGNTTLYTVSTTYDASAYTNVIFEFQPGAMLSVDAGKTLTLPSADNIKALLTQQIKTGTGLWVFANGGTGYPEWCGADGTGLTNSSDAIEEMDTALGGGSNSKIVGVGNYLLETTVSFQSAVIDFKNSLITMADAFPTGYCIWLTGYTNKPLTAWLYVDGNKLNQVGAGLAVNIQDISSPLTDIHINVVNAKIGVAVQGNSEKLNVYVNGYNCDLLATEYANVSTPDEIYWKISGSLCDMWFSQTDETSAHVVFNVENNFGATDYAVKITGAKSTTLAGIIRGSVAGGVYINGVSDIVVNFENLTLYSIDGNWALYAYDGRTLTGDIFMKTVNNGGADICYFDGGININLTVNNLQGGNGLKLGLNGVNDFRFGHIKYTGYGNSGVDYGVVVDSVSGHLSLDMTNSDHTLYTNNITGFCEIKMSARAISADTEISINDENPIIKFIGGTSLTIAELNAYSYGHIGMSIDGLSETGGFESILKPIYYSGGNWSQGTKTYTVGSPTLVTNGIIKLNSSGGAITATLPDCENPGDEVTIWMSDASTSSTVSITHHVTSDPEVGTWADLNDKATFYCDGAEWFTVRNDGVVF